MIQHFTQKYNLNYYINRQKINNPNKHNIYCVYFSDFTRFPNYEEFIANLPEKSCIIYREYKLNPQKRQELALKVQKIAKKHHHKLIIGKNFDLARKIKADGYHFSDFDYKNSKNHAKKLSNYQKIHKNFIISLSCHNLSSVQKAQNSTIDILFFSSVYHSRSHPHDKTHGSFGLKRAKTASKLPIFALGGVNQENLTRVSKTRANGFGGIEIFNSPHHHL